MAAMPCSAEGGNPPTNKNPTTVEIRVVGEAAARAITVTTVNAQVSESFFFR